MLYQFREYAQKINASQDRAIADGACDPDDETGIVAINFAAAPEPDKARTFVCSGARRGGSSTLPYILTRLGVAMGNIQSDSYEDTEMLRARQNAERLLSLIEIRNAQGDRWGFKIPALRRGQYGFFEDKLRNPIFLHVVRDPLMTAQSHLRHAGDSGKDLSAALQECLQSYLEFVAFMRQTKAPCLLVPLDSLTRKPDAAIRAIAGRLDLEADEARVAELAEALSTRGFKARDQG